MMGPVESRRSINFQQSDDLLLIIKIVHVYEVTRQSQLNLEAVIINVIFQVLS